MDGLNKVLDKLGIYDLTAVLLPGIIAWSFTIIIFHHCFLLDIRDSIVVNNAIFFLSISYFMGLVLQELGSVLLKYFDDQSGKLLSEAIRTDKQSHRYLREFEKKGISEFVQKHIGPSEYGDISLDQKPSECFEFCRNYLLVNSKFSGLDKDRSLAAFSRSLAVFCGSMSVTVYFFSVINDSIRSLIASALVCLFIVFVWRCYRLSVSWHINILKRFYYVNLCTELSKDSADGESGELCDKSSEKNEHEGMVFSTNAFDSV